MMLAVTGQNPWRLRSGGLATAADEVRQVWYGGPSRNAVISEIIAGGDRVTRDMLPCCMASPAELVGSCRRSVRTLMPLRRPPLIDQPIQMICPSAPNQDGGLSLMAPPKGRLLAVRRSPTATVVSGNPYQFVVKKRCVQVGGLAKH